MKSSLAKVLGLFALVLCGLLGSGLLFWSAFTASSGNPVAAVFMFVLGMGLTGVSLWLLLLTILVANLLYPQK